MVDENNKAYTCLLRIKIIFLVIYPSLITYKTGLERETKVPIIFKILGLISSILYEHMDGSY